MRSQYLGAVSYPALQPCYPAQEGQISSFHIQEVGLFLISQFLHGPFPLELAALCWREWFVLVINVTQNCVKGPSLRFCSDMFCFVSRGVFSSSLPLHPVLLVS